MTPLAYAPLWCKTNFSFLEGASHPEEIIEACARLGIGSVAITDRNGVYGIVRALVAAEEHKVRLIVGSELSLDDGLNTVVVLVRNREGYANLCRLVSTGQAVTPKGECTISVSELCKRNKGLIALWIYRDATSAVYLETLRRSFGDRLYAVVTRHREERDAERERATRTCAGRLGIPLVAATEVLYHERERSRLCDVLTCIRRSTTLDEAGTDVGPNAEHHLRSPYSMAELFADDPRLIAAAVDVADRCRFSLRDLSYRYPEEAVPEGYTTMGWLRHLTFEGAHARYAGRVPIRVAKQVDKELALIEELGYAGYFLTVHAIVRFCEDAGILCQGRGSAANSAVCYCLGVTAIDPVKMDLLFERFLSRERDEPPDIDIDIEHARREEVIQHLYERYGRDRAAMVANVIRYRPKSAVREVGKVLGVAQTALDRCAKLLSHWDSAIDESTAHASLDLSSHRVRLLLEIATELIGFPRHLSIHPGGFLLGNEPVDTLVPIEPATMPGRTVIQWDKDDIETLKLFKVDVLGLGALTHAHLCFDLIERYHGRTLSLATIPADDTGTFDMMCRADTIGVFQIESRAQMSMLPRLRPRNYYDLVIELSIVRPGPITGNMVHPYLRRRNGEEDTIYPHGSLEPVLKKTLGVPLFQEQAMRVAMVAADYTPGEADQLRRDMAAWRTTGKIERHRKRLIERMVEKGIAREFAERVYKQIQGFGSYGFPESHAAGFALIAYATAYLKCHYPAAFACALLNAWPMGFYAPATIVDDAKRHGVTVLPITVLRSDWDCTLERDPHRSERLAVRLGLRYVKGLGVRDWEAIRTSRRRCGKDFRAFLDLVRLDRDTLVQLALAGAYRCFDVSRRDALFAVLGADARRAAALAIDEEERTPSFSHLSTFEVVEWDHETGSASTFGHPLEPFRRELSDRGLPDARRLADREHGDVSSYVGMVICRQMPSTAGGVVFMTLEDESGFVNLVIWKRIYEQYRVLILTNEIIGITGAVQKEGAVVHLVAERFWIPTLSGHTAHRSSRDFH